MSESYVLILDKLIELDVVAPESRKAMCDEFGRKALERPSKLVDENKLVGLRDIVPELAKVEVTLDEEFYQDNLPWLDNYIDTTHMNVDFIDAARTSRAINSITEEHMHPEPYAHAIKVLSLQLFQRFLSFMEEE